MVLAIAGQRAGWVQETYITEDTEQMAADANRDLTAATVDLAARLRGVLSGHTLSRHELASRTTARQNRGARSATCSELRSTLECCAIGQPLGPTNQMISLRSTRP